MILTLTCLSPWERSVGLPPILKAPTQCRVLVSAMLRKSGGKLSVYASSFELQGKRVRSVKAATKKLAELLNLDMEVVSFREKLPLIYVYYNNGDDESVPIYCDKDGKSAVEEIYAALRNMMFVLSFHPKHSALRRQMRKMVMQLS